MPIPVAAPRGINQMSSQLSASDTTRAERHRLTFSIILGIVGVTLFVATEAFAGAVASAWAISGLMHFSDTTFYSLAGVLGLGAAALTAIAARLAYNAETHPDNN